ncbi:Oidioi.mRNA.OKI2018_I69.XSR.g13679.t1.cds [Oikopleura dioica]|uniref:E3 ubiquitin protein ligase n=1 Tax=Oikopleura dioica TaxID=34765 RepID=A0ABN7SCC3_OIKDI|nr:Oidioi.mRNA.OKI2018_I69.XSR.g13679.t1.cds [Oikopleura dioica]
MMKRTADEGPDGLPLEKKVNAMDALDLGSSGSCMSSLPQYRLGTISSSEELDKRVNEFSKARLVDLLEAEKKIKSESLQRAEVAEKKLAEKKAFYRVVRSWWKEFSAELGTLTNQPVNLTYHFPTEEEVQKEFDEAPESDEVLRVFGRRLRSENDFTLRCVQRLLAGVNDAEVKKMAAEVTEKNRDLSAELEKVENDLEEKTELCEDLKHKCEQLTKRNYRLIGQMKSRSAKVPEKKQPKEEDEALQEKDNEIAELRAKLSELQTERDNMELRVKNPSEAVIITSGVYQSLKAQFSVLYQQSELLKRQAEDARASHEGMRNLFLRQLEQMECEELNLQEQMRTKLKEQEAQNHTLQLQYDKVCNEYHLHQKATEQAGPINREMRQLINSLQSHNRQLKAELNRQKRKTREQQQEIEGLKAEQLLQKQREEPVYRIFTDLENEVLETGIPQKALESSVEGLECELLRARDKAARLEALLTNHEPSEANDYKMRLAEMESRLSDLRTSYLRRLNELPRDCLVLEHQKRALVEEYEAKIAELKRANAEKELQDASMQDEFEKTGLALEEIQEQNVRLVQDLRDKDKEYFNLFQERIKIGSLQQIQAKEKEVLESKILQLEAQAESQQKLVRQLEEKEMLQTAQVKNGEQELSLRTQIFDGARID